MAKLTDVLDYITTYPGMNLERLHNAFRRDVRWSVDKLEAMGAVRVEFEHPDHELKKGKMYFPVRRCPKCNGRIVKHPGFNGVFDLRCLMCGKSILNTNGR